MVKRRKLGRRRDDNRVAKKDAYALIQDSTDSLVADADELSIPEPETAEHLDIASSPGSPTPDTPMDGAIPSHPSGAPADPRIFAIMGATGGVGATSIATQLAHELAVSKTGRQANRLRPTDPTVCLIDLDFENGACAHHLDLLPSLSLEDLCAPPGRIDPAFTQALVSTHECGVSLLATPNRPGANAQANPLTILAMLDAAAELFDTVVIDLPRYTQSWSAPVMRAVDVLGLTCELTIPSLHAARERLSRFEQSVPGAINAQVIVGKHERRSFKNTLRLGDAESALGRSVFATICLDPDTTREALNCGEPAGVVKPDSRFVKDVRKLARSLATHVTTSHQRAA